MFQGASALNLDAKGRMTIPAKHRDALIVQCEGRATVTRHPHGCLLFFPRPTWETHREQIANWPMSARAWQRMLSGRRLDLLDPSPLDVEISDIAHGLARVARWNGQTSGNHAFSVAQHSLIVEDIFNTLSELNRTQGLSLLIAEQNAAMSLRHAQRAYVLENGGVKMHGEAHALRDDPRVIESYLGLGSKHQELLST